MFLRVNDGNKDFYYKIEGKKEITIGRASNNDIAINAEGVSRTHLKVIEENGDFYVQDLGATNGTFINDEKLAPNSKANFNTFFPVQLGFYVKLHLCDEADTKLLEKLAKQTKEDLEQE